MTTTLLGSILNTTSGTHTVALTPAVGDLIILIVTNTGYTGTVLPTDNNADGLGAYSLVKSAVKATSADTMQVYVRNSLIGSATSTTFSHVAGTTTGGGIHVLKITGVATAGLTAIRQSQIQSNQAASSTPTPVLPAAALTTSTIIGAVFNATSPATMTPRTGYTELADVGYSTPTTGVEVMKRDTGETGTSIAWGGTSASAFCSVAIEVWSQTPPTVALNTPADTATGISTTPTLNFTGTDANSDAVEYEVQISASSSFLNENLTSFYKFDENTGTSVGDASGNGNTGTWQGTLGSQWNTGKINSGGNFNGTDNYVSTTTQYNNPLNFSTSLWFKSSSVAGTPLLNFQSGQTGTTNDSTDRDMYLDTNGKVRFNVYTGVEVSIVSANSYNDNAWHFAVATSDSLGNNTLYVDGISVGTSSGVPQSYNGWWRIGAYKLAGYTNANSGYFSGLIDEVGIWSKALSSTEVTQLYNSGNGLAYPFLLDKLSTTDAGFTAGHPFASGAAKDFTVQAGDALTPSTTYYWRVRAIDPTGTNTYGAWSTTRSFTVSASATLQFQPGITRLTAVTKHFQAGLSRITQAVAKFQSGITRITGITIESQPGASTITNSTVLFQDGFSNGLTNWTQSAGTWSTTNAALTNSANTGVDWFNDIILTNTSTYTDFELTADVKKGSANDQIVFRSGSSVGSGYGIQIRDTGNFRLENWGSASLQNVANPGGLANWSTGTWYSVRIRVQGTHIQARIWLQGTTEPTTWYIDYTDSSNLHTTGSIGFSNENNTDVVYDSLIVYSLNTTTTLKFQTGISSITQVAKRFQAGVARLTATTPRFQNGISRITITSKQFQSGLSRLTLITKQFQRGISRLTANTKRFQSGITRLTNTVKQFQPGVSRISIITSRFQSGVSRITVVTKRFQAGIANIRNNTLRFQTGLARLTVTNKKFQSGVSRVALISKHFLSGQSRIAIVTKRFQTGVAKVGTLLFKFQSGVSRITAQSIRIQSGIAKLSVSTKRFQTGLSSIAIAAKRFQAGISQLVNTNNKFQPGKSRITVTTARVLGGTALIHNPGWNTTTNNTNTWNSTQILGSLWTTTTNQDDTWTSQLFSSYGMLLVQSGLDELVFQDGSEIIEESSTSTPWTSTTNNGTSWN